MMYILEGKHVFFCTCDLDQKHPQWFKDTIDRRRAEHLSQQSVRQQIRFRSVMGSRQ